MTIQKPLKSLSTGDNVDKLGQFEDIDTITSFTFSHDPTGKVYATGTNISACFDNLDTEMTRIGAVVNPPRPCFRAWRAGAIFWNLNGIARQTTTIIAENKLFDVGNNYNNINGRFTAPVDGFYRFIAAHSLSDAENQSSYEHHGAIYVNGTIKKNLHAQNGPTDNNSNGVLMTSVGQAMVHLTAGQYVTYVVTVGGGGSALPAWSKNSQVGQQYLWFSGYLIQED